jgi:hypothetical protein
MQIDESPTSPVQHASDHPPRPVKHIGRASLMENGKGGNTLDQIRAETNHYAKAANGKDGRK